MNTLTVTLEPAELYKNVSLTAALNDFVRHLAELTSGMGPSRRALLRCAVSRQGDGRGPAQVFRVSFSETAHPEAAAWDIKVYFGEGADEIYSREVSNVRACLARLDKDIFSAHMEPLGPAYGHWGIAYLDSDYAAGEPMITLGDWIVSAHPDAVTTSVETLRHILANAIGALHGVHETTVRAWEEEYPYFARQWLPHFTFNAPSILTDSEVLLAVVDGVSAAKIGDISTAPTLLKVAFEASTPQRYLSAALRIARGSLRGAKLSDFPLRITLTNTDFDFSRYLGDYVQVSWRGDGREVTSIHSAVHGLINSAQIDARLEGTDVLLTDAETEGSLHNRLTRVGGAHTDLHLGNIRVNPNGALTKCKIIDLSDLGSAPFHADLARLEMSIWLETAPRLEATYEDASELLRLLPDLAASDSAAIALPSHLAKYRPMMAVIVAIRRAALSSANMQGVSGTETSHDYHITLALTSQTGLKWAARKVADGMAKPAARYVAGSALALAHSCKHRLTTLPAATIDQIQAEQVALAAEDDVLADDGFDRVTLAVPPRSSQILPAPPSVPLQAIASTGGKTVGDLWELATHRPPYGNVVGETLKEYFRVEQASLASQDLLPIQLQMLERPAFFTSRNCLVAGPTSCGKTFAADLIAVSEGFVRERPSIYIAPTRALAQARHEAIKRLIPEKFRERVILSTGEDYEDDGKLYRGEFNIATMVYEKANVLFASEGFPLAELGVLIIDELHMLEDLHRGIIVELLISKMNVARRQMLRDQERDVPRLVLISTEKSLASPEVTAWLDEGASDPPESYFVDARPVPVDHYLVLPSKTASFDTVFVTRLTGSQDFQISAPEYRRIDLAVSKRIEDGRWKGMKRPASFSLARPEVQESHTLAFDVIAALIERAPADENFRILAFGPSKGRLVTLAERIRRLNRRAKREYSAPSEVTEALRNAEPTHALRVLDSLVNHGVYLHNADIDRSVRRAIEHRFEVKGSAPGIEVLLATSTLSYGVNLAVDSVVLIQPDFPFRARDGDIEVKPLPIHELQNMLGRAGRYGKSYGGSAYITCSLYGLEPMKDVVEHYYHVGDTGGDTAPLESRLMTTEDLVVAGRMNSRPGKTSVGSQSGSAGGFSYPFVRAVLDVLRHVDSGFSSRSVGVRPPAVEDVVEFLGHTLFAATERGKSNVRLMETAVARVLAACAEQPVKIVERVKFDDEEEPRYRLTPLGGGVIDTGTELSTLVPMLTWVRFLREPEFQRGRGSGITADTANGGDGVPPELFMFGLFLVAEVWRTAREFAPESRGVVELGNEVLIDLNRREVRRLLEIELEALGIARPDDAVQKIDQFIATKAAPELGGQVAYENAHADIAYRIFVATCRWVQGRAIEDVEALAISDVLATKGLVDRIRSTVERMSWLAIALYRCINESAKGLSGVKVESEYERPLLLLARRLRHGCVAEGLPLINRPQSALRRHHVAALVAQDLTVDRLLSNRTRESLQLLRNTLEPLGVRERELIGLTWDIVDFALRREEDLSRVMSQGTADGVGREELRLCWRDLYNAIFGLLRRGDDRSNEIIAVLDRAIRLLHGTEGQRRDAEGSTLAHLIVKEDTLEIVSRHGDPTFRVGLVYVRPEVERRVRELPPSIRITSDALANAASALAKHDNAIVVGLPWFLPNAVQQLADGLRPQLGSRRSLLMTPSCLLGIVSLIQRRFLALEDLRDGFLKHFNRPINVVSVSDLPVKFALPQLPATLRESMMNHYQVTHRRRNA